MTARSLRLSELNAVSPLHSNPKQYFLENGNSKIGYKSDYFEAVFVWNIPPVSTCPGKSEWCTQHCYNGDDRPETYHLDNWGKNWWGALNDREGVKSHIIDILRSYRGKTAVRIHSSGDFFSVPYIALWLDIVGQCPSTSFWAYTRSWTVADFRNGLNQLRTQTNVQLFASWDETMPSPPNHWRISLVDAEVPNRNSKILDCPEQYQLSKPITCAECRYCLTDKEGDVFFVLH